MIHKEELFDPEMEGRFDAQSDVVFILYTQANRGGEIIQYGDSGSLSRSQFNPGWPTRFIIHGWNNDRNADVNTLITNAYLQRGSFNVIVVDWGEGANTINYISARNRVNEVGPLVGQFINNAVNSNGLQLSNTYIIGHSLGGHTAGIAGKTVNGYVRTVFGLDPAGPLFSADQHNERINKGDGEYTEIIHTNGWTLGFGEPLADTDFFPNGGKQQAGCGIDLVGTCSHSRAYQFFAESINNNNFRGIPCLWNEVEQGNCSPGGNSATMGGEPSNHGRGVFGLFYLRTGENSPFALG